MRKILLILAVALLFNVAGCLVAPAPIDPQPQPYIPIPEWVTTAKYVSLYIRSLPNMGYESDESLTGYSNYYFTPAEFFMTEIPDANNPDRIIRKPAHRGDCDDFAIITGYIAEVALNAKAHYVVIKNQLNGKLHAISYVPAYEGGIHVFDLWLYMGVYEDIEDYVRKERSNHVIRKDIYLDDFLAELFQKGHVIYYTEESRCHGNCCLVQ